MQPFDDNVECSLLVKTRQLLMDSHLKPQDIFAETNLPFYWIQSVMKGTTKAPSVNRIQYLYEYLSEKQLQV